MPHTEGTVRSLRSDHEGRDVVLRFVLVSGEDDRLPVEMRGHRVRGVLEVGDRVRFSVEGRDLRDDDGVARPELVENLSTDSVVQAPGSSPLKKLLELVTGFVASVLAGIVSSSLLSSLRPSPPVTALQAMPRTEPAGGGGIDQAVLLSILVALLVTVVVFYLIYLRPRLE
jgi:hypothetical protein